MRDHLTDHDDLQHAMEAEARAAEDTEAETMLYEAIDSMDDPGALENLRDDYTRQRDRARRGAAVAERRLAAVERRLEEIRRDE